MHGGTTVTAVRIPEQRRRARGWWQWLRLRRESFGESAKWRAEVLASECFVRNYNTRDRPGRELHVRRAPIGAGAVSETVSVEADAPLVSAVSSGQSQTFERPECHRLATRTE